MIPAPPTQLPNGIGHSLENKPAREATAHPSFDCATANFRAAALVCGDAELAAADRETNALYRRALARAADPRAVEADHADWIALRRNACTTRSCLASAYAEQQRALREWLEP